MHKTINKLSSITLAVTLLLASCSSKENQTQTETTPTKLTLEVVSPIKDQLMYDISLPGELKPFEHVNLYAKIKGFVKKVYVDRGSFVKKGQLLAVLEAPEITHQYISAKSDESKFNQEYLYAQQAFDRLNTANKTSGAVAGIELDRALSNLNSAKATLDASKAKSNISAQLNNYLKITAPFDGMITQRNISEGALVGDNTEALFDLAQNQKLRLTVAVPEKHAQSIQKDMNVSFTVNSIPGKSFSGKLSRSGNLIQQDGRALLTEFDVDNGQGELNGGEYAQVKLQLRRSNETNWVPITSIVRSDSGTFIWKVDENQTLKKIIIIEGIRKGSLQEVFGLIDENDKIIKNGSEELTEGAQIEIK